MGVGHDLPLYFMSIFSNRFQPHTLIVVSFIYPLKIRGIFGTKKRPN